MAWTVSRHRHGVGVVVLAIAASSAVVLSTPPPVAAAQLAPEDEAVAAVIAKYQAEIPRLMAEQNVPGVAVALVDGDDVVWTQGFGSVDGEGSAPVTTNTIFSAESTTKVFTATAVMEAVGKGLVNLDVPITTYLPDFTVHSAFEDHPERRITLRMLLSHTAGFTHEAPIGNNDSVDPGTFDEHVRSISDTWLRFPVGTGFAYSNLGIDLAGYILEKVEGKPFAELMRDDLLQPLGMNDSTFDRAQIRATSDRAIGHTDGMAARQIDMPMTAAGGLYTSATDLAQFLRFELNGGSIDGRTVLDPGLIDEQRTIPAPFAGDDEGYALGISRTCWHVAKNTELYNHGGGGWGFLSDLWWAPKLGLGIAVLTNSQDNQLQVNLPISILNDLIHEPGSVFNARLAALPPGLDNGGIQGLWVPPASIYQLISDAAMPPAGDEAARWATYSGSYKSTSWGIMDPFKPPEQFVVVSGVPYFDSVDDSGVVERHRLTEIGPGMFLADNGETLDFGGPVPTWRNLELFRVSGGPAAWQWLLLGAVDLIALIWLVGAALGVMLRRRRSRTALAPGTATTGLGGDGSASTRGGSPGRRAAAGIATLTGFLGLATTALVAAIPGLVDSGFLGWLGLPPAERLLLHLPLAVAILAIGLGIATVYAWRRRWWSRPTQLRYGALTIAAFVFTAQLALWHLIGWGLT